MVENRPAPIDYLAHADYNVVDGHGGSVAQTATITITGVNDGPVVSAAITQTASEDDATFSVELLQGASDPDSSDILNIDAASVTASGDTSGITLSGNSLSVNPSAYNHLAVNESEVISYSYNVVDGHGGSVAQTATITITGVNDGPAVSAAITQTVTEDDASFSVDLLQGASDPDTSDTLNVDAASVTVTGDASGITLTGNSLTVNPAAYNHLAVNESEVISYGYNLVDGHGGSVAQTATITITGLNDGPAVSAAITQTVTEDDATFSVNLLQGASDPDTSDILNIDAASVTASGDASGITLTGNNLTVNPAAYNHLAVNESEVISYGYNLVDGHGGSVAQTATVTITGLNDDPVVGNATFTIPENTDSDTPVGMVNVEDVDYTDVLSYSITAATWRAPSPSITAV